MRLAALLCPLAAACDAGAALPPDTAQRTALIAVHLGRVLGWDDDAQSDLLFAGLVRHLGCSATAHEETQLMGDELELRSSFAYVDKASPVEMLKEATRGFARGRSRVRRARTVAGFMVKAPIVVPRIFNARCEVAIMLGRRIGLSEPALVALDETYERFDGKGVPRKKSGAELSRLTRVLGVAEWVAALLPIRGGEGLAFDALRARSGTEFDPEIVRAIEDAREEVVAPARRVAPLGALFDAEPRPHRTLASLRAIAEVLADFADLKSTFTLGHSRKVSRLARAAGDAMGLADAERDRLELAGLLHDIGRVSVSNAIWDKPGPLDAGEWEKVHAHPQFTERVLRCGEAFAELAPLAAADHERLDGRGYPRGASASPIARVLAAADVVQALGEPRPHRAAYDRRRAAAIAVDEVSAGRLDRAAVNAVLDAVGETAVRAATPKGLTEREIDVLRHLARGAVDKEIAVALGISHRTVHHHNQSIFGKLGVQTRGAAALFAVENGLV